MGTRDTIENLQILKEQVRLGGGEKRILAQKSKGKLTARERIDALLDPGSFFEMDALVRNSCARCSSKSPEAKYYMGDGVVMGWGHIDSRKVVVFAYDFTVSGGSLGEVTARKICKAMDLAYTMGVPIIGLNDSGGARIQEGVASLAGFGDIFFKNVACSGYIPQITAIMGPCAGGAVYSPALNDFVIMVDGKSHMFITGPEVVKTVTKEEVSFEELGGAFTHATHSGVANLVAASDEDALRDIRLLLSYLPGNNLEDPPVVLPDQDQEMVLEDLNYIIPDNPDVPYDMYRIITRVVDRGSFFELAHQWAGNIIIGFARLNGQSVGIVANQPKVLAGCLDINASIKAARFVRMCDTFNIPLITFVDVPGFMPGVHQEHSGIIRHGAKLIYAYCEATVPKLAVITRKAYGGAYIVMSSKHLKSDMNFAWPTAEIAVMGAEGAVNILFGKQLKTAEDPEGLRKKFTDEYKLEFQSPYIASERGYIDEVILPCNTRVNLIRALQFHVSKRVNRPAKKHGNMPL